jgi:two-component system, NtrC family, nitrogen regulation response regulator NtrX
VTTETERRALRPPELVGTSPGVLLAADAAARTARSSDPMLIVAERGFSAERIARFVHGDSPGPFLAIDCGGSGASVIRELFGASSSREELETVDRASVFAQAQGGTLLLSNISELPAAGQLRLSRLLRDDEMRVDGKTVPIRTRVIASAYPGLEVEISEHRFRAELYERLQRMRVDIPPLRDRAADMPQIITTVLQDVCASRGTPRTLAPAALTALASLPWPGNLDELRLALDRLVDRVRSSTIRQEDVIADLRPSPSQARRAGSLGTLREARLAFEREYIAAVLKEHGWRMSEAARTLGIQRANLYRKTRQLGIHRVKPSRLR